MTPDFLRWLTGLIEAGYMWARGDVEDNLDHWHQRLDDAGK